MLLRRLALLVPVAALALAVAGCNSDAIPPGAQYASVAGLVTDSTTHQPIAGALVVVDAVLSATTDANGAFLFPKVPIGEVDYTVQAEGHVISAGTIHADAGKVATLNVALAPPQPSS